ncbi:MAG TPA: hypothetical protein VLM85_27605 [Polyangiaceae bacterium]|nr:hypothetical protein [Polyangiaceae bacterium]
MSNLRYPKAVSLFRRLLLPATLGCALLLAPSWIGVARADEPTGADIESARAAFLQGLELRDKQHDPGAAVERFKAAYALVPTPRIGFELGKTLRSMGDLVGARAAFVAAVQLPARHGESPEAKKAREDAEAQAAELEPRIPQLLIHLQGEGQIYVDGEALRREALAVPRRLNPGNHVVQVQVEGDVKGERTVTLREGDRRELTLSAGGTAAEPPPTTDVARPPPGNVYGDNRAWQPPQGSHSNAALKSGLLYLAYTLAGVGVGTGAISLSVMKGATDGCDSTTKLCTATDFGTKKDMAIGFAVATDVLWGAALVSLIVALALPRNEEPPPGVVTGFTPMPGGGLFTTGARF